MIVQVVVMIISSGWAVLTGLVIQDHVFIVVDRGRGLCIVILALDYLVFSFEMVVLLPCKCLVTLHGSVELHLVHQLFLFATISDVFLMKMTSMTEK